MTMKVPVRQKAFMRASLSLLTINQLFFFSNTEDVERGQEQFDDNIKSLREELLEAKKVVDDYRNSFHATEDHQQAITALPIQKTFHHSKILPPNETAPLQPENMDNESKGKHEVSDEEEDLFEDTKGPDFFMVSM